MMQLPAIILLFLYIAAGIYDCVCARRGTARYAKPFLMPVLLMFYIAGCAHFKAPLLFPVVVALLFSWIGDILLMFRNRNALLAGTFAFAGAHISYTGLFLTSLQGRLSGEGILQSYAPLQVPLPALFAFTLVLYAAAFVWMFRKIRARMRGFAPDAVILYALLIWIMSLAAFLRHLYLQTTPSLIVWAGSVLFVVSDSLIALNLFVEKKNRAVMQTYLTAQFLIVAGCLL